MQLPGRGPATGAGPTSWSNWGATTIVCGTRREDLRAADELVARPTGTRTARRRPRWPQPSSRRCAGASGDSASEIVANGEESRSTPRELVAWPRPASRSTGARACPARDAVAPACAGDWRGQYSTDGVAMGRWRRPSPGASPCAPAGDPRRFGCCTGDREIATGVGDGSFDGAGVMTLRPAAWTSHPAQDASPAQPRSRSKPPGATSIRGPTTTRRAGSLHGASDHVGPRRARAGRWVSGTFGW